MSNSNLPKFGLCLFPISIFWLCLFQNPSYYEFFICQQAEFFMSISKGLIPNSTLCLIPKVLLQRHIFGHSMSISKGLPTPILGWILEMILFGGRFGGVLGDGWGRKWKKSKNFDGLVETNPTIPHNSGFVWILEMTLLGGRWEATRTLRRGPGETGEVKNENK